jgi:hypothetical protein
MKTLDTLLPALLLAFLGSEAKAVTTCSVLANPASVREQGLAEPLGEVVLRCEGGGAGERVAGSFFLTTSTKIANRLVSGTLPEPKISIAVGANWLNLPVTARLQSAQTVAFDGVDVNFDAGGVIALRISGVRAVAAPFVQAYLFMSGVQSLPVSTPLVFVAGAGGSTIAATSATAIPRPADELPTGAIFDDLIALRTAQASVRVSELQGAVLEKRSGGADAGIRLLVRYNDVPARTTVLVPDLVAGSNAQQPTSGGDFGTSPAAGQYAPGGSGSLLLARVAGANPDGTGGTIVASAPSSLTVLESMGAAEVRDGQWYAVYEVLDSNRAVLESIQIPAFFSQPPDCQEPSALVTASVSLAPVSEVAGASSVAPVPRFLPFTAPEDCSVQADCDASYFPKLAAYPFTELAFTRPQGPVYATGTIRVYNAGGDILSWNVSVRYKTGSGWVRFDPAEGLQQWNVRFDLMPQGLEIGTYDADIVITGKGRSGSMVFPVRLTVTAPLPPPIPAATIRSVVNSANRIPGPIAPGLLALIEGDNFLPECKVLVSGIEAMVVARAEGQLVVVIPETAPLGARADIIVVNGAQAGAPYSVEAAPVAPAVLALINPDGTKNGIDAPVRTGSALLLQVTGISAAEPPVYVKLHDRVIAEFLPADGLEAPQGASLLRFLVPADLPAMTTAIEVCGQPAGQPEMRRCAHPVDVTLSKPE